MGIIITFILIFSYLYLAFLIEYNLVPIASSLLGRAGVSMPYVPKLKFLLSVRDTIMLLLVSLGICVLLVLPIIF
ncbi:hypothetical protein [Listeria phage 20422-1]|uniref:Uncharacterized protein n=3 Tax=Pecentumvirus LP048 TaxID=2560557 RepID=A0A5C2IBQ4_9CAUD|nr:hypothetical protein LP048_057 [Listeria phage LP-048]AHL19730.1 hypothetical protein LP048_057 [Listeria phage LP-048]QEP53054.2 hypothetical protein FK485_0054 [Listeria phage LP-039]QNL31821.1 hypothetical protein HUK29_0054 [Listeria phage LP-Mix_6.1]